jgi:hypothetical protein
MKHNPAYYLANVSSIEGVPVVRSVFEQLHTPLPHLCIYPNGSVKLVLRSTFAVDWDPSIPLRKQLQPQ